MATLIKTDGTEIIVHPKNGTDFKLEKAQKFVDGYVEVVNLRNGTILIVNEEGKFTKQPNRRATEIALEHKAIFHTIILLVMFFYVAIKNFYNP